MPGDALLAWLGLLIARSVLFLPVTIVAISQCLEMHFVFTSVTFKRKYTHTHTHTHTGTHARIKVQRALQFCKKPSAFNWNAPRSLSGREVVRPHPRTRIPSYK